MAKTVKDFKNICTKHRSSRKLKIQSLQCHTLGYTSVQLTGTGSPPPHDNLAHHPFYSLVPGADDMAKAEVLRSGEASFGDSVHLPRHVAVNQR